MKSPFMLMVFLLAVFTCAAADLELRDGKVLKDVRLLRRHEQSVAIAHSTGGGTFSLSEFTDGSAKWISENEPYRTFSGEGVDTNESNFAVASRIALLLSPHPSFRTMMGARIDSLLEKERTDLPISSAAILAVRSKLLKDAYVTSMFDEHFDRIHEHLKSPLGRKLTEINGELCAENQKIVNQFLEDHPEKTEKYREELSHKSKSTGLFQLHVRSVLDELDPFLAARQDKLLRKYLTDTEVADYNRLKEEPFWQEMENIALRVEIQIRDIARNEEIFRPGANNREPSFFEVLLRFEAARIRATYGINIHYDMKREAFLPYQWYKPPVSVDAQPASVEDMIVAVPLIEEFIKTYPIELVRNNLSDISVMKKLNLYGKPYGGTYTTSTIYCALWHRPARILNTLHHEFSSILVRNYGFPLDDWQKINDPDWKYPDNALDMLGKPDTGQQTEALLEKGFVTRYATSTLENDINETIEWITCEQDELKALSARYDRIRLKSELLKEFYRDVRAGRIKRIRPIAEECLKHAYVTPDKSDPP